MKLELFHRIANDDCAAVRRRAGELGLLRQIELRNVHFESHRRALATLGGNAVPALWDGAQLHVGRDAAMAALASRASGNK